MAVRTEELRYDSRDRETKLYAKKWLPEGKPRAILQIVHGMSEFIDRYDELATWMANRGVMVMGNDHLGHGKSRREGRPWGYFCRRDPATVLVRDVHRLKKIVQEELPGIPMFLLGHSLGGFIAREYISRYGTGISGAILEGTGIVSMGKVKAGMLLAYAQKLAGMEERPSELLNKLTFSHFNDRIPKPCAPNAWLSHNEEDKRRYAGDPAFGFTFTVNGFMAMGELIKRIQDEDDYHNIPKSLPILILAGKEDPTCDYGRSATALYRQYTRICHIEDVSIKLYDGMRHEIHKEKGREEVFKDIDDFIVRVSGK